MPAPLNVEPDTWQQSLRNACRDPLEVLNLLGLSTYADKIDPAPKFPFIVPREFVSKMQSGDFNDPLLRQVLPLKIESQVVAGFGSDPTAESGFHVRPGLLRKYKHRALIITTGGCAINCRYCFRREFPYQGAVGKQHFDGIVTEIRQDASIEEIILSGGDPLSVPDSRLSEMVAQLSTIPQLKRLRIHTRLPITIPARITPALEGILGDSDLEVAMVLHSNHANEIDSDIGERLKALHRRGINLLNQSVLLRGVNDDSDSLGALSESLFSFNVLPYYLHMLDPVSGSAHFAVPLEKALRLERDLNARLPGYLVPKFVREVPGANAKTAIHAL